MDTAPAEEAAEAPSEDPLDFWGTGGMHRDATGEDEAEVVDAGGDVNAAIATAELHDAVSTEVGDADVTAVADDAPSADRAVDPARCRGRADAEPATEHDVAAEAEPATEHDVAAETEPAVDHDDAAEAEPVTVHDVAAEAEPATEHDVAAETEPAVDHDDAAEAEPVTEHDVAAEAEPVTEHDVAAEAEPVTEHDVAAETETEPVHEVAAAAEPGRRRPAGCRWRRLTPASAPGGRRPDTAPRGAGRSPSRCSRHAPAHPGRVGVPLEPVAAGGPASGEAEDEHAAAPAGDTGFFSRDDPVGSQYVDFDEVRKELVQIGIVWLGEANAAPVTALLTRTRSTIDDFVATIDTIRGLHLEGQDPASIQAMAREMHQQAAERLCGA